jgi:hypothetical protein
MEDEQNPVENQEIEKQEEIESTGEAEAQETKPNQEEEKEEISEDLINEEAEVTEEKPVSRRESKRIQAILDKLAQGDTQYQPRATQRPNSRQVIPEGEYDLEQVNEMAHKYGEEAYNRGLSEAQAYNIANTFVTRLEIDTPRVNSKYEFLDAESSDFDPGVAGFVNRMYLNAVGYDPNTGLVRNMDIRYGEFIDGVMDMIDMVSTGKVADSAKNIAGQAARTGVRPGGSTTKPVYQGGNPKKMTDAQLDAVINQALQS